MAPQDLKDLGFREKAAAKPSAAGVQSDVPGEERRQAGFVAGIRR